MNGGAYDGTSNVEAGFDNFSGGGKLPGWSSSSPPAMSAAATAGHAKFVLGPGGIDEFSWAQLDRTFGPGRS